MPKTGDLSISFLILSNRYDMSQELTGLGIPSIVILDSAVG